MSRLARIRNSKLWVSSLLTGLLVYVAYGFVPESIQGATKQLIVGALCFLASGIAIFVVDKMSVPQRPHT